MPECLHCETDRKVWNLYLPFIPYCALQVTFSFEYCNCTVKQNGVLNILYNRFRAKHIFFCIQLVFMNVAAFINKCVLELLEAFDALGRSNACGDKVSISVSLDPRVQTYLVITVLITLSSR